MSSPSRLEKFLLENKQLIPVIKNWDISQADVLLQALEEIKEEWEISIYRDRPVLIIHYPELELKNEHNTKRPIYDLFVCMLLSTGVNLWSNAGISCFRTTFSAEEMQVGFIFSHTSSRNLVGAAENAYRHKDILGKQNIAKSFEFIHEAGSVCTGSGPFPNIWTQVRGDAEKGADLLFIRSFFLMLRMYFSTESLEGGPYINMTSIPKRASRENVSIGIPIDSGALTAAPTLIHGLMSGLQPIFGSPTVVYENGFPIVRFNKMYEKVAVTPSVAEKLKPLNSHPYSKIILVEDGGTVDTLEQFLNPAAVNIPPAIVRWHGLPIALFKGKVITGRVTNLKAVEEELNVDSLVNSLILINPTQLSVFEKFITPLIYEHVRKNWNILVNSPAETSARQTEGESNPDPGVLGEGDVPLPTASPSGMVGSSVL